MSWVMAFYSMAVCDRCGNELEDEDSGSNVLFKADEPAHLHYWEWHEVQRDDGTSELICRDCWERIGTEDADLAKAILQSPPWPQRGPDLFEGDAR